MQCTCLLYFPVLCGSDDWFILFTDNCNTVVPWSRGILNAEEMAETFGELETYMINYELSRLGYGDFEKC